MLDDLTMTTRNMVAALQQLQNREAEANRRAEEEATHHAKMRELATALEADQAKKHQELEQERANSAKVKEEAEGHFQAHTTLCQELASVREELSSSQATVESLRKQLM